MKSLYHSLAVLVFTVLNVVNSEELAGYIVEVDSDCSSLGKDEPTLTIISDYSVSAIARCAGGDQKFTTQDKVHFTLPATFQSNNKKCQFLKRKKQYYIEVVVMYGGKGGKILRTSKTKTVVCSFDDNGKSISAKNQVVKSSKAPEEIIIDSGTNISSSHISVKLQTVLNQDVKNATMSVDSWISILATSDGKNGEKGIRPVSCEAVSKKNNKRYSILKAGCAQNSLFRKGSGFITSGRAARSPYFKPVVFRGDLSLVFECKFILCTNNCDGSSCVKQQASNKKKP